jgi:hypothetical protein
MRAKRTDRTVTLLFVTAIVGLAAALVQFLAVVLPLLFKKV